MKINADINQAREEWIQVTLSGDGAADLTEAQIEAALSVAKQVTFISLNARVRVKLTEHGKIILEMDEYTIDKPDENGFLELHLWELMRVFGPVMFNGNPNLPFEENVLELLT